MEEKGDNKMTFKQLLSEKGYSVQKLSEEIGVDMVTVYRWIKGCYKPYPKNIVEISKVLNISVEELNDCFNSKEQNLHPFQKILKERRKTLRGFCQELGVHHSTVYYWMTGRMKPNKRHLSEMSNMLNISSAKLDNIFAKKGKANGGK